MSTEILFQPVTCPKCESALLAERLQDVPLLCASCRTAFVPPGCETIQRTSRRAIASFVLGLLSLFGLFLTGIPAICLGLLAFRDIQRSPRALRGTGLAVGGIASGLVFGLACGTCVSTIFGFGWAVRTSTTQTEDPAEIHRIAHELAEFEPPPGAMPLEALEMSVLNTRTVVYGQNPRPDHPLIVVVQLVQGSMPTQVDMQVRNTLRSEDRRRDASLEILETQQLHCTIRGEDVAVRKTTGFDRERDSRYREYVARIPEEDSMVFAALVTPDEAGSSPDGNATSLSDDEVRAFFESFR